MDPVNPLKASEARPDQMELLFQLTEYLVRTGRADHTEYPSSALGYLLAIKALWQGQTPNGYGYILEKISEGLGAYELSQEAPNEAERKRQLSLVYQSLYKIGSGIEMLRTQRRQRLGEE